MKKTIQFDMNNTRTNSYSLADFFEKLAMAEKYAAEFLEKKQRKNKE